MSDSNLDDASATSKICEEGIRSNGKAPEAAQYIAPKTDVQFTIDQRPIGWAPAVHSQLLLDPIREWQGESFVYPE